MFGLKFELRDAVLQRDTAKQPMEHDQSAISEAHPRTLRQASLQADEVPTAKKDLRPEALMHGIGSGHRVSLRSDETYFDLADLVLTYGAWGLEVTRQRQKIRGVDFVPYPSEYRQRKGRSAAYRTRHDGQRRT